jgi:hypothetical protein
LIKTLHNAREYKERRSMSDLAATNIDTEAFLERVAQAEEVFVGKAVAVTHEGNSSLKNHAGQCENIVVTNRVTGEVDFVFTDGSRTGVFLENVDVQKQTASGGLSPTRGVRTFTAQS